MTIETAAITALIERLAQAETADDAYNEYAHGNPFNDLRRANLQRYLLAMREHQPKTMLVLEAPGYRGCRLTGVPVTSRKLLLQGVPELEIFGQERGFVDVPEPGFERIQGEQSATIVWGTLASLGVVPLIWNTFPFHPHRPEQPLTNRKPRQPEVTLGLDFLQRMVDIFQPLQIIAVGNVAEATLSQFLNDYAKVRHPAQGGKNDFVAGIQALMG
ncbi:MAG: uracil-DNA glycosylase [Anaerolineae bacterium]|nr:uracil-DNA glycosylase [Anaerolineae bacterium]